jgi:hypothetical protein
MWPTGQKKIAWIINGLDHKTWLISKSVLFQPFPPVRSRKKSFTLGIRIEHEATWRPAGMRSFSKKSLTSSSLILAPLSSLLWPYPSPLSPFPQARVNGTDDCSTRGAAAMRASTWATSSGTATYLTRCVVLGAASPEPLLPRQLRRPWSHFFSGASSSPTVASSPLRFATIPWVAGSWRLPRQELGEVFPDSIHAARSCPWWAALFSPKLPFLNCFCPILISSCWFRLPLRLVVGDGGAAAECSKKIVKERVKQFKRHHHDRYIVVCYWFSSLR